MTTKRLVLTVGMLLVFSGSALAAERTVIVGFKQRPGRSERSLVYGAAGAIHRSHRLIPAMTVTLPEAKIEELKKDSRVAYVEENAVYTVAGGPLPRMPRGGASFVSSGGVGAKALAGGNLDTLRWGSGIDFFQKKAAEEPAAPRTANVEENYSDAAVTVTADEYENSWGVTHIGADLAHASGNRGAGVTVAILDTGIDYNHEDLDDNYLGGWDFISGESGDDDPFDDNYYKHGTHVAGIVAAENNGFGVVGVAPKAKILAVKVLGGDGFGSEDSIISGIEWAVDNGADIINMSIQGPHTDGLEAACNAAYEEGVLLVAAGGNSSGGLVMYPAAYDSVIGVTAIDADDDPASFAPIGAELSAPGVDIISTTAAGEYDTIDGTSQAAPHVTGVAALFMLLNTEDLTGDGAINHEDVRERLNSTATDLGDEGVDLTYGTGLVNAASALGDDGSTDDGSTDDGSTDDGSTDDGSTDDGGTDDGVHYVHDILHEILFGRVPNEVHDRLHELFLKVHHQVVPNPVYDRIHDIYHRD